MTITRVLPVDEGGALSPRRQLLGFLLAIAGGPLLTWLLVSIRADDTITGDVLAYQLLVVVVALIGGIWPAVLSAITSGILLAYFFVAPFQTISVADPRNVWALVLYVVIAVLVSYVVDRAARAARSARRAASESELLMSIAGAVLRGESAVPALLRRTREALGLAGVRLRRADGVVLSVDGEFAADAGQTESLPVGWMSGSGPRASLELQGRAIGPAERRILGAVVAQLAAALERSDLVATAREADALAAADQVRSALLSAVSHDLRRPLAAAVAAVGGLRAAGSGLSADDRDELLATADESLTTLTTLVTDLLDVSRVQAGVLAVSLEPVDSTGAVLAALDELALGPDQVELRLDPDLPSLLADPVLLQRVLVNVVANAHRHSPTGAAVVVSTGSRGSAAVVRIADRGPGIPAARRDDVFVPFQRLGDDDNATGLGLGLALSKGFVEGMGGSLVLDDTDGGGLTAEIVLSTAPAPAGPA